MRLGWIFGWKWPAQKTEIFDLRGSPEISDYPPRPTLCHRYDYDHIQKF